MLIPNGNVREPLDFSGVNLFDTTGIYKAADPHKNISGYNGGGNGNISAITVATLTVTKPDLVTLLPSGTPVVIDVFSAGVFPNVINVPSKILATTLGYSDGKMVDGAYTFRYDITIPNVSPTTYSVTIQKLLFARVECCINSLLADLEVDSCCCDNDDAKQIQWGKLLLSALCRQLKCGKTNMAIATLKELQNICNGVNCRTCP